MNEIEAMHILDKNITHAKNLAKWQRCEEEIEMMDLCRMALEKQIPKRAKETQEMMDVEYICPICRKVNHDRARYCWGCGQAISH